MSHTRQIAPLAEERARIDNVVQRLHETADPTERADLASALVRAVARYEDVVERALVPPMAIAVPRDALERQAAAREHLRDAMTVVHERTMHIDPRNVHTSDPDGFERAIDEVLSCIEAHFPEEDRSVDAVIARVGERTDERAKLEAAVAGAAKRPSERPHPPKTTVGRLLTNTKVKLDHAFEDVATPHHPGAQIIDDATREG